jgi:hypothetical protein
VPVSDRPADRTRLEDLVGHPQDRFNALCARIQDDVIKTFQDIENDFLSLIWCMDSYRAAQVVPRDMGNPNVSAGLRLGAIYRGKGNFFSTTVALILSNMTTSRLAARSKVWGFSQPHQIDIAWPDRDAKPLQDPLICCEAKLTGAPPYPGNKGRKAMADWSNRRKELKFQATDLKLYRKSANTRIENWDLWRRKAPPSVYSLWAARLHPKDDVKKMIEEARILSDTYCDGVGIYAFRTDKDGDAYEAAPLSAGVSQRVTSLDTVLGLIAAEIREIMDANNGQVPQPVKPPKHPVSKTL